MPFNDYDYYDYRDDSNNLILSPNTIDYSNLKTAFQEKNDTPLRTNQKFDYAQIIKQNRERRQQQLQELRLSYARKNLALNARFSMPFNHSPY
jgi:hypothetical protein